MNVALVGITGYSGMILYQMLSNHPHVKKINLYRKGLKEPELLKNAVPLLTDTNQQIVLPYDPTEIMKENQVVFFATPSGVTSQFASPYIENHFPVIDLSGDFRLMDPDTYAKWYKKTPAKQTLLQQSHYGLADFSNAKNAQYVANPGCYATATLLGLAPLVQKNLIDLSSVIVDAKSGVSGAGKTPTELNHFVQVHDNLLLYKVNQHQHIPEIMQQLKLWNEDMDAIQFNTTLLPITRGIMNTMYAKAAEGVTKENIKEAYETIYENVQFVRYTGENLPTIKQIVGTNFCDIGVIYNEVTHMILVVSVIDNLIKGAGGQAIQNFNQMFDFDENEGLPINPVLP